MSTYVWMKILESTPNRYDKGLNLLTLGRLNKIYDDLTSSINKGDVILDIGCGTGNLTVRAAMKGAIVKGIDVNPRMLSIAYQKIQNLNLEKKVNLVEMGVAELSDESDNTYDRVISGLCFSELTEEEQIYTLKEIARILKPGGTLIIADEVIPGNVFKRILNVIVRIPLIIITYLLTQTTTRPLKGLPEKVQRTGLLIESVDYNWQGSFMVLRAKRKG